MSDDKTEKKKTGFAAWSPERHREVSSMGGKAVHDQNKGYKFTSETAKKAAEASRSRRQKKESEQ